MRADYLLTHDNKGFPVRTLLALGVTVTGVDEFLCALVSAQQDDVMTTILRRSSSLTRPPMTLARYLEGIALTAPRFAALAASAADARLSRLARLRVSLRRMGVRLRRVD